jgi:hypothetical protein
MTHTRGCSGLLTQAGVAFLAAAATLGATASIAGAATAADQTQFSVSAAALAFSTTPALPPPGAITRNGAAQTTNSTMTNIGVSDATGSASGWNVTVIGNSAAGKSPVFNQYCRGPHACGADHWGVGACGRVDACWSRLGVHELTVEELAFTALAGHCTTAALRS